VRELRETVKFAPTRSKFKIYIIDEVHMLSNAAFNALLKTLEEPPSHVKFIFATTEPEKVLATIVSRCQRFDLRRIAVPKIVERLQLIADSDGITVEPDALLAIARGAEGGMRDAQSAFDQLISFRGKNIVEDDVLTVFGLVSRVTLENLAQSVLTGDIRGVISVVGELDNAGKDLQRIVVELMAHFRNLLICLNVDDPGKSIDLTEVQLEALVKQAHLSSSGRLLRIVDTLSDTESRMRYALSRRTLLETALIRCSRAATVVTLDEILEKINALKSGEPIDDAPKAAVSQPPPAGFVATRPVAEPPPQPRQKPAETTPVRSPRPQPANADSSAPEHNDLDILKNSWASFIERVGNRAVSVKSALYDSVPVAVDELHVTIAFPSEFEEEMDNFKSARVRAALRLVLKDILKRDVDVVFKADDDLLPEVVEVANTAPEVENVAASLRSAADTGPKRKSPGDWQQNEHVQKLLDEFNGFIAGATG
jgi:DNA polymerase-3 subunit gamma/tau